mgnify:CR=1 FL=1
MVLLISCFTHVSDVRFVSIPSTISIGKALPKLSRPQTKFQCIENLNICLDFLKSEGFGLVNIGAEGSLICIRYHIYINLCSSYNM